MIKHRHKPYEVIIHADDFGLSRGVNDGILQLLHKKRISGTACMVMFDECNQDAIKLQQYRENADIGLHITLTDQPLLGRSPALCGKEGQPLSKEAIIKRSFMRQLDEHALRQEIILQIQRFYDIFNFLPDYYDGHQHVQLLPAVRNALFAALKHFNIQQPYIRNVYLPLRYHFALKPIILRILNRKMRQDIVKHKGCSNNFFAGSYNDKTTFAQYVTTIFQHYHADMLMMCHPASVVDVTLQARDSLLTPRIAEFNYLMSDDFFQLLEQTNYEIVHVSKNA